LKTFLENIVFKLQKEVICLGIYLVDKEERRISLLRAKIHGGEIKLVAAFKNLASLKEAAALIPPGMPVILHLDGWGVLIKDHGLGNGSISAGNPDFIIREYQRGEGEESCFSVIRRDLLENLQAWCASEGVILTGFAFGPFSVALLAQFFRADDPVKAGKWEISLKNGHVSTLTAQGTDEEKSYDIGGDQINSGLLPLYASAVRFFTGEKENNSFISRFWESFVYRKLLGYLAGGAFLFLLTLLLANFILWNNLRNKNMRLMSEVTQNERLLTELNEYQKEIREKEELVLHYIGSGGKTHHAWYADRLASTLPTGIHLTILEIQPPVKKPKPGISIEYQNNQVDLEGDAPGMSEVTDWIRILERERWVKQVELVSYLTEKETTRGHFKLRIYL